MGNGKNSKRYRIENHNNKRLDDHLAAYFR